jgi:hypothetical protein
VRERIVTIISTRPVERPTQRPRSATGVSASENDDRVKVARSGSDASAITVTGRELPALFVKGTSSSGAR